MSNIIKEDAIISGRQSIGYEGIISLSLVKNKKVLTTKTYHNSGMPKLFEFLAKCLGGNKAESLRPVKIKLFKYSAWETTDIAPAKFHWDAAWEDPNKAPEAVSSYILYNTTPVVRHYTDEAEYKEEESYEVTLHFSVPSAYIASERVDIIGLYPNGATNDQNDVSVYYLFTKDDGAEWDPLLLEDVTGDFNLFIDWTLRISNKTK